MSEHQDQTKKRGRGPGIKGDLAHAVCKVYETNSVAVTARVFGINDVTVLTEEDFREVMKALEDLSFECFSPIAPCNPPSVATYSRTFEVLNKHRAARGWKVVPKSPPQGAEE